MPETRERLDSWKEIANYLHRRVRTVIRWEKERGLPVHRLPGGKQRGVFAFSDEIDTWLVGQPADRPAAIEGERRVGLSRKQLAVLTLTPLITGLLGGLGLPIVRAWRAGDNTRQIHTLAVLPLQNLSGDPSQDYVSDGLTEALITDLAQIRALRVISRTSVMQYKGAAKSLPQIAHELNADTVVEGSVLQAGARLRVTVQLVQARKDEHLWAGAYEGDPTAVLALQRTVTQAIVRAVRLKLTPGEQERLTRRRPANAEAYDLYLKGRFFWNKRDLQGFDKAVEYLSQAVQKDSSSAVAQAGLADAYVLRGLADIPANNLPQAQKAAHRALELDDTLAEAHVSLGAIKALYEWDWASAEREFKRAIELSPDYATAHHWYATLCLVPLGRFDEALAELKRARELDPLSLAIDTDFASVYEAIGQFDKALELCREIVEMDHSFAPVHLALSVAYEKKAMHREEIFELREYERLAGTKEILPRALEQVRTKSDYRTAVRWQLDALKHRSRQPGFWQYDGFARLYARLGERDLAFAALRMAVDQRDPLVIFLKADRQYDSLRTDLRMEPLLRRIGLSRGPA